MLNIATETGRKKILVIGVGGAGNRIVSRMVDEQVYGVELIGVDTNQEELAFCKAPTLIDIGEKFRDVGASLSLVLSAVEENREILTDMVKDADMALIICGMGGKTGTGAAPAIANIAKEQGILTIGVATSPSKFETHRRKEDAILGIELFKANVDSLIVIPNDNLLKIAGRRAAFPEIMEKLDETLVQVVRGITGLITLPMITNFDYENLFKVMRNKGPVYVGIGSAKSIDSALERAAIRHPLTEYPSKEALFMKDARHVIAIVSGGISLSDFETVTQFIGKMVEENIDSFVALNYDGSTDGVRATVIATGFEENGGNDHD